MTIPCSAGCSKPPCTKFGYERARRPTGARPALAALDGPDGGAVAAVILDLSCPGSTASACCKAMRERGISIPVIVQTAQGGIETVVSAMRNGAFDFVVKPASPERLRIAIANALKVEALEVEAKRTSQRAAGTLTFKDIVTTSPAMERVSGSARRRPRRTSRS